MSPALTRFGLIRHGRTRWNEKKRIQGHLDSPLTAEGEQNALAWGRILSRFSWNRILASDLGRARQTAHQVNRALNLPVTYDSRLREQDWGAWTGKTLNTLRERFSQAIAEQEARGWDFCPPGGESRRQVRERSLQSLAETGLAHPGERILVVCHRGVIKCLLYGFLNRAFLPHEPRPRLSNYLHWMTHDPDHGLRLEKVSAVPLLAGA